MFRPLLLLVTAVSAFAAESLRQVTPWPSGVGISDRIADRPADWPLLTAQFGMVTPENCMKPAATQPAPGQWRLETPDRFVEFARSKDLKVVGHCLVWAKDDRTPAWFYRDGDKPASKEVLLARMKEHIDKLVGRYRGRIAMWDVVNEALADGGGYLRESGWTKACGEEFIAKAFEYAHAADPDALLIYNDYNNELDGKREQMLKLIAALKARQAPIHAIGLQGHYEIDRVPFEAIEKTLVALKATGLKVVISELDIDVIPRGRWWADNGAHKAELAKLNPYADGCPPDVLARQAEQYAQLFRLFRKHSEVIARVSFWNLHDGQSWLNDFPWKRVNHPLLFDRQGQPKPAFAAVLKEFADKPTAAGDAARWITAEAQAPRVSRKVFKSAAVGGEVSYHLYQPEAYGREPTARLPVVYWLHGSGGGAAGIAPLAKFFDDAIAAGRLRPVLVVFVNGLPQGMYVDWRDGSTPIESMIIKDLIPHIDASYRTIASKEGRVVDGFSMGGYGAARLGFKYPELFRTVSMLGAGPLDPDFERTPRSNPRSRDGLLERVYGDRAHFREVSPWEIARRNAPAIAGGAVIRIAVGEADATFGLNREFHDHLNKLGVPHEWTPLPEVGHDPMRTLQALGERQWEFYRRALGPAPQPAGK